MISIIKIVLPVVVSFFVGIICRKKKLIDDVGNRQINSLLQEVVIPLTLFNSLFTSNITAKSFVFTFSVLFGMILSYILANFFKKFFIKDYQKFFPEMMVSWEGGSIGISLCSLLFGTFGLSQMAIMDFGGAIMLFGILIPIIRVKEGAKSSVKEVLKLIFGTKAFIGILLGVICSILGLNKIIFGYELFSTIYHGVFDIIISPLNFLIMLSVGYGLNINRILLKPVILTCICRVFFMGIAFLISSFIIFNFITFDKKIFFCLAIAFSLPQTFAYPIFSDLGNREYLSTTLSFMTVVCLLIFVLISTLSIVYQ